MLTSLGALKVLVRRVVDLDFDEISKWAEARSLDMPDKKYFPKTGFIVNGIAAGFIYYTDSPIAIIDCYLSNPGSLKEDRDKALDLITEELIKNAVFHKCLMIKCDTGLESIKKRALKFGFNSVDKNFESFMLEIN